MPRYIDADKQKNLIDNCADLGGKLGEIITLIKGYAKDMVDATPTADVVEVVRCKDCKYGKKDSLFVDGYECSIFDNSNVEADDFCSYGEKKNG